MDLYLKYILKFCFLMITLPVSASAQIESHQISLPAPVVIQLPIRESQRNLFLQSRLETNFLYLDNADLMKTQIDKQLLLTLKGNLDFYFQPADFLYLNAALEYRSLLIPEEKNQSYLEQPDSRNSYTLGKTYFKSLSITFAIPQAQSEKLKIHAGRHFFFTDNFMSPDFGNYIFPEQINGLSLRFGNLNKGFFDILVLNVLDIYQNQYPYLSEYADYPSRESDIIGDFNGDVLSFQSGLVYSLPDFLSWSTNHHMKFYLTTFFTRFGPVSGGIERAGNFGNFPDNDYVFHYGAGALYSYGILKFFFEVSRSNGIDRKLPLIIGFSRDIQANGYFTRSCISLQPNPANSLSHTFQAELIYSEGPAFDEWGNKTNYGYVSTGNFPNGGLLLDQIWGYRPYAMVLNQGISNKDSYGFFHSSGSIFLALSYHLSIEKLFEIMISSSFLFDTSNPDNRENFFESSAIFPDAQSRYIGNGYNLLLTTQINPYLTFFVNTGVFIPGNIYNYIHKGLDTDKKDTFNAILLGMSAQY